MKSTAAVLGMIIVLAAGCVAPTESPEEAAEAQVLSLTEQSADTLRGSMTFEELRVDFSSRRVSKDVFSIEVLRDGLTMTADLDYTKNQFRFDGFATDSGEDTVLDDDDKLVIAALAETLSAEGYGKADSDPTRRGVTLHTPGSALSRALAVWHLTPVSSELRRDVKAEAGRTILYHCGYLTGYGIQATHDCWDCWNRWDGWNYVNVGMNGYGVDCYPDSCSSACGNYGSNTCGKLSCEQSGGGGSGSWQWGSDADKYGACTAWDTNAYVQDCLDHDHCVRNDHATGSSWCSDEAASAIDDQPGATNCKMINGCSGRCNGSYTSSTGVTCYCDAACDTYGDCCSDYHLSCDATTGGYVSALGRSVARTGNYASRGGTYGK